MVRTASFSLLSLVLVTSAASIPANTIKFTTHINTTGFHHIADADRERASSLLQHARSKRTSSITATNGAVVYTTVVGIGSPATSYTLLIDTGSSNTWVGAGKKYVKTKASTDTYRAVGVTYGSGWFEGYEYTDTVSLSSALTVTGQGIGVASRSSGFSGYDGILGIGPLDLTEDTVNGLSTVPTITHTLKSQGKITAEAIGIYFAPTTSSSSANGELTFGGPDTSKVTSTVGYVPLTLTYPASAYWGINQTVTYGSTTLLPNNAGIVDTGTTLILLATDALKLYVNATGATYDSNTGLYKLSTAQYAALQPLNFVIGSTTYSLTANAQIFPRSLNRDIGGTTNTIYLIVADLGQNSGSGLDFINGYAFLERFYSVFDTANGRVGFASTVKTNAATN